MNRNYNIMDRLSLWFFLITFESDYCMSLIFGTHLSSFDHWLCECLLWLQVPPCGRVFPPPRYSHASFTWQRVGKIIWRPSTPFSGTSYTAANKDYYRSRSPSVRCSRSGTPTTKYSAGCGTCPSRGRCSPYGHSLAPFPRFQGVSQISLPAGIFLTWRYPSLDP